MMRSFIDSRLRLGAVLLMGLASVMPALAATYRVDDSGTTLSQTLTPMRWRHLVPSQAADNTVDGQLQAALRLNLANWVHKPVRIYMALSPTQGEQLQASWRTQGRLLPGTLRGGERALVFEGVITEPSLNETIELKLSADGRLLTRAQSLQFYFEIEVAP
jgi:hypothetical protein